MKEALKKVVYFAAFTAPMGAQFLSISVGGVKLSLFRIAIIILILGIVFQNHGKVLVLLQGNRYSVSFMLFMLIYSVVTVLWVKDLSNYVRILFFLAVGVISVIAIENVMESREEIYTAVMWLELGILLQAMIGWYEIATKDYRFLTLSESNVRVYINSDVRIPIAMAGNPNDFATMMFFGVFFAFFLCRRAKRKTAKVFLLAVMVNCIALVFQTESRANIIGLLLAGILILIILKRGKIAVLLCALLVIIANPGFFDSVSDILQFNFQGSGSDGVRLGLIKSGFALLWRTFGFGVGIGQIEAWMQDGVGFYVGNITNMHNWWMEILTSCGIFVFAGYCLFYVRLFLDNYKAIRHSCDEQERRFSTTICALLVGFVIASVSSSSNMTSEWLWFFWAICIGYQGIMWDKEVYPKEERVN